MRWDLVLSLFYYTIKMATPLLLCTIGGVFVQKAGTMNFALEAAINFGCFCSVVFTVITERTWVGAISAFVGCILLNVVFGLLVVNMDADATVVGMGLNMLMMAIPPYLLQAFWDSRGLLVGTDYIDVIDNQIDVPILRNIPILRDIFNNQTPLAYAAYLIIAILTVVFYRTKFGVYTQVTGENLLAAEAVGVNTKKIKWIALLISAVCSALAALSLTFEQVGSYSLNMSSARGLICLSAINCGRKEPIRSCLYALLFGFTASLKLILSSLVDPNTTLVLDIVPYLTIVIVFLITETPVARKNTMRFFREG